MKKILLCTLLLCTLFINLTFANTKPRISKIATLDSNVTFSTDIGGRGSINYSHYGMKNNGQFYFKNTGSKSLEVKIYLPGSTDVFKTFDLLPSEDREIYLSQGSYTNWCLTNGTSKIHFATPDGGDASVYCKYTILDHSTQWQTYK